MTHSCFYCFFKQINIVGTYLNFLTVTVLNSNRPLQYSKSSSAAENKVNQLYANNCNVIINKTKVLLPQAYVTLADFGDPV
jgi:hypothetical protein